MSQAHNRFTAPALSQPAPASQASYVSRPLTVLWTVLYTALIHLVYSGLISPAFAYMGYTLQPHLQLTDWLVTLLFIAAPVAFLRLSGDRPSNFILLLLFALVYVPTQYMLTAIDIGLEQPLMHRLTLLMGLLATAAASARPLPIGFDRPLSAGVFRSVLALLYTALFLVVASQFGFGLNLVSILDVYDVRSEYKDEIGQAGRTFAYAVPYLGIVSAFMAGYGLIKRFFPFALLGTFGLLYIFGTTGQKSTLFSLLLLLGLALLYQLRLNKMGQNMLALLALMVGVVYLADLWTGGVLASSLFVRRMILTPGLLTTYYLDFFSVNPPAQLAHSFLSSVFMYPYDLRPAFLIGREYFASPAMSANANIFADAYSNFRGWGVLGFSLLLGGLLALIDGYSRHLRNPVLVVTGLALPAFALTNSALFTTLLTHGFLFATVLTYLYAASETRPSSHASLDSSDLRKVRHESPSSDHRPRR